MSTFTYIDLYDLNLTTEPSYRWADGSMYEQERAITRELEEKGYEIVMPFYSTEKDSFGPLSRGLKVKTPEGNYAIISYG